MAQKRIQYVKTSSGLEKQLIASAADIVEIDSINGLSATNVQDALEEINNIAMTGGVTGVKGDAETDYRKGSVNISKANIGLSNVTNDAQVKRSEMAVANGVATLDSTGKVPSNQLPSYVDDVLEYDNKTGFPTTGETGKIYVAKDTNLTYRWSGTAYVEISPSLALGETSSTAYAGDKGKALEGRVTATEGEIDSLQTDVENIINGTSTVEKANSANKLSTARKISLSGDVTGNTTFDGSADKTIAATLSNTGITAGTYSALTVDAKGRATAGAQIIEWGTTGQTTASSSLAIGGIFFQLVE